MEVDAISVTVFGVLAALAGNLGAAWLTNRVSQLRKDVGIDLERHKAASDLLAARAEQKVAAIERRVNELGMESVRERIASLEAELVELRASASAASYQNAHLRVLSSTISSLEKLATSLLEARHLAWEASDQGRTEARRWIGNVRREAAHLPGQYTEFPEYDYELLVSLRVVTTKFGELAIKRIQGRTIIDPTPSTESMNAIHAAMALANPLRRTVVASLRNPPSSAPTPAPGASS